MAKTAEYGGIVSFLSIRFSRRMNGLSVGVLSALAISLFSWYLAHDTVACTVTGAGTKSVNGYYSALGGIYFKRGQVISYFPDVFRILSLRREMNAGSTIALTKHSWVIFSSLRKDAMYRNSPEHPEEYISYPPPDGWLVEGDGIAPVPTVVGSRGSLQDSPPLPSSQQSNMGQLLQRPVTTLLLGLIIYIAYHLWSSRTDVADVSYSYDAIIGKGEYWRMVTSSFAHFDAWHLMFNTMSLYQLGELEATYGSVTFAYLNADLVFITMVICLLFSHILITKFGRIDQATSQAVGFSCVLFAWMVAASVRMRQYCPIFILPTLCFTTYYIPNPLALINFGPGTGFPVNIGPVLLLIITKVIIPRSSFLGHLSGIVIGYPLAWNLLNWLTPPLAFSLVAVVIIYQKNLLPSRFTGYDLTPDLNELAGAGAVGRYRALRSCMWAVVMTSLASITVLGPIQILPRLVMAWLAWSAVQARRCEWLTTLHAVHEDCLCVLYMAAVGSAIAILYDLSTLGSSVASYDLLLACELSSLYIYCGYGLLALLIVLQNVFFCYAVTCINDIKLSESVMLKWRLNDTALQKDIKMLGLNYFPCFHTPSIWSDGGGSSQIGRHVFDGPGRRAAVHPGEQSRLLTEVSVRDARSASMKSSNTSIVDIKSKIGLKISKGGDVPAPLPFPVMPSNIPSAIV